MVEMMVSSKQSCIRPCREGWKGPDWVKGGVMAEEGIMEGFEAKTEFKPVPNDKTV